MGASGSKLKTVLKIKKLQLKKAQRDLAAITVTRETEQGHLSHLEQAHSSALADTGGKGKTRAEDLQVSRAFIDTLSGKIKDQSRKVSAITTREEAKRDELLEQSKTKEMLLRLDQRREGEEERERERKTQRVVDVLAQRLRMGMGS
jgi:flagellar export protein FliJ